MLINLSLGGNALKIHQRSWSKDFGGNLEKT